MLTFADGDFTHRGLSSGSVPLAELVGQGPCWATSNRGATGTRKPAVLPSGRPPTQAVFLISEIEQEPGSLIELWRGVRVDR
jgi:hypothetical protein